MEDLRVRLKELSAWVDDQLGEDVGFSLFVELDEGWNYTSNHARKDAVDMLQRWLALTAKGLVKAAGVKETSVEVDDRLALERVCVEVSSRLRERTGKGMGLFLFHSGKAAYFSNVPDIRDKVARWVELQRSRS
jgi:hypothetical protein